MRPLIASILFIIIIYLFIFTKCVWKCIKKMLSTTYPDINLKSFGFCVVVTFAHTFYSLNNYFVNYPLIHFLIVFLLTHLVCWISGNTQSPRWSLYAVYSRVKSLIRTSKFFLNSFPSISSYPDFFIYQVIDSFIGFFCCLFACLFNCLCG